MKNKIFQTNESNFLEHSLEIFYYQYDNCPVYREYCALMDIMKSDVKTLFDIPFLPISFFKSHKVICSKDTSAKVDIVFSSSATTGMVPSKHYVLDVSVYDRAFMKDFKYFYENIEDYTVLALLPSYLERKGSSLIYMIDRFIKDSKSLDSGYYLYNYEDMYHKMVELLSVGKKCILFGVTFALLDFVKEYQLPSGLNSNLIVFETGGMKGRGKELSRDEIHARITKALGCDTVNSEYGMCELLSQGYSKGNGLFYCPPWMKILIRDLVNPFEYLPYNKKGGINVIDLANINSCSFIETEDLGTLYKDSSYTVEGRISKAERRGCNMIIE
ncbi:MAG: acyltransferase [Bacteroidales bacterium]